MLRFLHLELETAKRILSRKNPELYDVGWQAVVLGLMVVVFGLALIIISTVGLIQEFG